MTTTGLPRPALADRLWTADAACAGPGVPADLWAADPGLARAAALHVCRTHCPVLTECHAESSMYDYRSMVVGGVAYDQRGNPTNFRFAANIRCPLCPFLPQPWPDPNDRGHGGNYADRPPAPCGTTAAYDRHRRRGQPIDDACREAHNAATTARKRAHRARAGGLS